MVLEKREPIAKAKKTSNWFVRGLIVMFCAFLAELVVYKFFYGEPKADISAGLLVLLAFILVLVLSELFNTFSLGQLVTMTKVVEEKEAQRKELKQENSELRALAISTNVSQRQANQNQQIVGNDAIRLMTPVKRAGADEIADEKREEDALPVEQPQPVLERRVSVTRAKELALSRFVSEQNLQENVIRDAKLPNEILVIDPVTNVAPIFDAYINTASSDIFLSIRLTRHTSTMFLDRLYVMLTKVHHYKTITKKNSYLTLVLLNTPDNDSSLPLSYYLSRLDRQFQPAIVSSLLRIHSVNPNSEELESLYADTPIIQPVA
jgi:hypothetical protein